MKWIFIVFCVYLGSLFFRTARVPGWIVREISVRLSSEDRVVSLGSISFGFASGLRVNRVFVYKGLSPVVSLESACVDLLARSVTVAGLKFPRLGDSYYQPGLPVETCRELSFDFPAIPECEVVLDHPEILGVKPARVVGRLTSNARRLRFSDIVLQWPDPDCRMMMNGTLSADLDTGVLDGNIGGHAIQPHIRPLLVALDLPSVYPYFDAFTRVQGPVPASCAWRVNLRRCEFRLDIDLAPKMGSYNAVPLDWAKSHIAVAVETHGTNFCCRTDIGPLDSRDLGGRRFGGTLSIVSTNGVCDLLIDADSSLSKKDTFGIIGYLNDGELDVFETGKSVSISGKGRLATDEDRSDETDLSGHVAYEDGAIFGLPVKSAAFDYRYHGDRVTLTNFTAMGKTQGSVRASTDLVFPGHSSEHATFSTRIECENMRLEELARVFDADPGDRDGNVTARMNLSGSLATNTLLRSFSGDGSLHIDSGHLSQVPLFAGLTTLLSDHVPGVSQIVNQGDAAGDFVIRDGVLSTESFTVEGKLFSIEGKGSYDLADDRLDFIFRTRFMRNDSFLKMLIRPITWPFSKLLLEVKLTGSLADPKWSYINILDRVL